MSQKLRVRRRRRKDGMARGVARRRVSRRARRR